MMTDFIALKQDTEYYFALITAIGIGLLIGYEIGEHEKFGGKISDLWQSINKSRALTLLKKIGK